MGTDHLTSELLHKLEKKDMFSRGSFLCFVLSICLVPSVSADAIRVRVELEGTLKKEAGNWSIKVDGEGEWLLDLSEQNREYAANTVKSRGERWRVRVMGSVRAQTQDGFLRLKDRTVDVSFIQEMTPGVRVEKFTRESPANGRLKVGDIIIELDEQPITGMKKLTDLVKEKKGKEVTILVVRDGVTQRPTKITLNNADRPLGVDPADVWVPVWLNSIATHDEPKAPPEKKD
jgi:hypothetical protein